VISQLANGYLVRHAATVAHQLRSGFSGTNTQLQPFFARWIAEATMTRIMQAMALGAATAALTAPVALGATAPDVTTGSTGTVADTGAVLEGTVNPNGTATHYFFEWGPSTAYGASGPSQLAGSGVKPLAVHIYASRLLSRTTYHYRLVAVNAVGTVAGADATFTTTGSSPPQVSTGPATQIGTTFATANGSINPEGAPTTWAVQYGPTKSYGVETFARSLPSGGSPVAVSATLRDLAAGTLFHYRLVARHGSSVVSYGPDQLFMTYPSPRRAPFVRARTAPHHAPTGPFVFTTLGRVEGPGSIPRSFACTGKVRVDWFLGRRRLRSRFAAVRPDCSYRATTRFTRAPARAKGKHGLALTVRVRFLGNRYLARASSGSQIVVLS
jgi:hypothetical protein